MAQTPAERAKAYRERCKQAGKVVKSGPSGQKAPLNHPFITIDGEAILCGWMLKTDENGTVSMPKKWQEVVPKQLRNRFPVTYAALCHLLAVCQPTALTEVKSGDQGAGSLVTVTVTRPAVYSVDDPAEVVTPTITVTAVLPTAYSVGNAPTLKAFRTNPAVILAGNGWVCLKFTTAVRSLLGAEELTKCMNWLGAREDHSFCLLASSASDEIGSPGVDLSSADCLRFLLNLKAKYGKAIYCGFSLGYDCEHWIRDYGPSLWRALKEKSEGMIKLDGRTYVIQYIPKKWFKIGFYSSKTGRFLPIIEVFDVFSFFQAGFVPTVGSPATGQKKGWGAATAEEIAVLTEWKGKRGAFAVEDWEAIREYNQIECRVLVRLMEQLRIALNEAGVHLTGWYGPGAVASFLLQKHKMKEHILDPPEEVQDAIARAYFGGRFECLRFGHLEGVYDYDISSAYPYATTLLPSTRDRWERVEGYQGDDAPWTVYLVSWDLKRCDAGELKPFPWRDERGCIHYPSHGRGWYWAWEVAAALGKKAWEKKIIIEDAWRLYPEEEGVFSWLLPLAEKRVAAKTKAKDRSLPLEEQERWQAIERAYKLALNSVYGKTIQTVGETRPYLCPMWAGLITAHTRARLLTAAIRASKGSLVCFATDGLFANAPIAGLPSKSDEDPELGAWSLEADDIRLELYQSGCYAMYDSEGEPCGSRFRGISQKDVPWDVLRKAWLKNGLCGMVTVSTRRFYGHRTALARNKPELQCQWVDVKKDIELHPGTGFPFSFLQQDKQTALWNAMWPGVDYNEVSGRYKKLPPGSSEEEQDEQDVQPD